MQGRRYSRLPLVQPRRRSVLEKYIVLEGGLLLLWRASSTVKVAVALSACARRTLTKSKAMFYCVFSPPKGKKLFRWSSTFPRTYLVSLKLFSLSPDDGLFSLLFVFSLGMFCE